MLNALSLTIMLFDRPSLTVLIIYATFPNLAALAFVNWLGVDVLSYMTVFFVGFGSLYGIFMELQGELEVFKVGLTTDKPRQAEPKLETRQIPNLAFEQVTQAVRFDAERNCCNILLTMHEQGMGVDLTEGFWLEPITLRSGKKHKRWQGKNKEFQAFKKREEGLMFGRENENGNARFVVRDEARLRLAAEGRL